MDDVEIRKLFAKTCGTINEYQKCVNNIMKDIQKMNVRMKDLRLNAMSEDMDKVIADYYSGIHDAGSLVDGLTERLKELERFVEVIDDLEGKVEQFDQIKDLLENVEGNITEIAKEMAFDRGKVNRIGKTALKMATVSELLENGEVLSEYYTATCIERLDILIEDMRKRIEVNKSLLKTME